MTTEELLARLSDVEAERDTIGVLLDNAIAGLATLRADQERMREALATYGFHSSACAAWARSPWREEDLALCDCGLAAALSTPRQP